MINLLNETINILERNGKTLDDIKWIGTKEDAEWGYYASDTYEIPISKFLELADEEYDDDFGGVEVNLFLVIVGDDWWLERSEYDGAEKWNFKTMPKRPTKIREDIQIIDHVNDEFYKTEDDSDGGYVDWD